MGVLIGVIVDFFLAKAFYDIACKKGHTEKTYFWVPFLLPIIGYIMVLALPDNSAGASQPAKISNVAKDDEKLYSLPNSLYAIGSPVIISSGQLYKAAGGDAILAQLEIENISSEVIKAAKVKLELLDTAERPLNQSMEHQYLDLNAKRGDNFGSKILFAVPNMEARAFTAKVIEVIFNNNSIWSENGDVWEPLCEQTTAAQELEDKELIKQYSLEYGADSAYIYLEKKDLWFCACGKKNKNSEDSCWGCGKSRESLKKYDRSTLQQDCEERLKKEAEDAEKLRVEKEKRKKKILKIASIATPSIIVCAALLFVLINYIIPASNYNKGVSFYEAKNYESAIAAFEAAGEYKDAQEQILACYYEEGQSFYEDGDYEAAIEAFEAAGVAYYYAEGLLYQKEGNYTSAIEAFEKAGEYQDAAEQAKLCFNEWAGTLKKSDNSDEVPNIYKVNAFNVDVTLKLADVELTLDYDSKYAICTGQVKNTGEKTYYFIRVECAFEDKDGNVLDTDWTYAVGTEGLKPGEAIEFKLSVTKDYNIKSGTVSILDCYVG